MTIPTETALQRISRQIAQTRFSPSAQSLGYLRDAFIDIYGCMLSGSSQPVALKTHQALCANGQIHPQASAVIYGTEYRATPGAAAMVNAIAGHALDVDSIEAIELQLPDMHAGILPFKKPQNQSEALFSLPYCAAMVLVTGNLTITDIENQSWQREDIKRLIEKISVRAFKPERPELNYDPLQPDRIVVECTDGHRSVEIPYPLGSPQRPISQQQLQQKFQLNARLDEVKIEQVWQRLQD